MGVSTSKWHSSQKIKKLENGEIKTLFFPIFPELHHLFTKLHEFGGFKIAFGFVDLPGTNFELKNILGDVVNRGLVPTKTTIIKSPEKLVPIKVAIIKS